MIVGTTEAANLGARSLGEETLPGSHRILNISSSRLIVLLVEGRVEGAYKTGRMWLIPLFEGKPIISKGKRGPAPRWRNPRKQLKALKK